MSADIKSNGIPLTMRGQAWPLLVNNRLRITSQIYEYYKNYMYAAKAETDEEKGDK